MKLDPLQLYQLLLEHYGPQGWWPLLSCSSGDGGGYHPGNYQLPAAAGERFEAAVGAILAQNISWLQAWEALHNLERSGALVSAQALCSLSQEQLAEAIRPARFLNSKARYLRNLAEFWIQLAGAVPEREALLQITGVGPETADSILLYAFQQPEFVVDAYTRRIGAAAGWFPVESGYQAVKQQLTAALPVQTELYNEFHALLVRHGSLWYSSRPHGAGDPLLTGRPD